MANFSRIAVVQQMYATGVIPVFYHKDIEQCKQIVDACYAGGARVFEFTNRADFAHEVFAELKKWASAKYEDLMLGIGSIVDAPTTAIYIQAGADFVVAPVLNAEMAKVCNRRKVAWFPGCGSLSEISYAEELGVEVVKIFPAAQVGGPEFVKAVKGPCPWSSIMPTGGVTPTEENIKEWVEAGVHCVGIGSQLIIKDKAGKLDLDAIEALTKEAISFVQKYRK